MIKESIGLLILAILFAGCSTTGSVQGNYKKVVRSDGISRQEALFIAQKSCFDDQYCRASCVVFTAHVGDGGGFYQTDWLVRFSAKPGSLAFPAPYEMSVDKKTGAAGVVRAVE